ncbi:hypothetical protein EMCRGX_G000163 [Ephydatia muelleri]
MCACDAYDPSLKDDLQQKCQDFVDNVKTHMPTFLQKQKAHLILHLVECMDEFCPTSSFNAESNRQASSRDIASRLQSLMHISQTDVSTSLDQHERFPSTKQFCSTYQCTLALDIQLAHPLISWLCYRAMILHTLNSFQPSTETVAVCKAIMSENCTLVNCGDYVDCVSHMNR